MHIHAEHGEPDSRALIQRMEDAGVYGGTVFSRRPPEAAGEPSADYDTRLKNVFDWTSGFEGRLFPVLWIHADEKDLESKIRDAAASGITASLLESSYCAGVALTYSTLSSFVVNSSKLRGLLSNADGSLNP